MAIFTNKEALVRVIASEKNWIESESVRQLELTAKLKGIKLAVGLPDLHPGKDAPVGVAFIAEGWIYPHLVGNDIGCGMGLWQTDLKSHKIKLDKWANKLDDLEYGCDVDAALFDQYDVKQTDFDHALGTIGGGNHFAELQKIESILDLEIFNSLKLNKEQLFLLVHSGSRGLGMSILTNHSKHFSNNGLGENSDDAKKYIKEHNQALGWAKLNRALIAERFLSSLKSEGNLILDVCHNSVSKQIIDGKDYWLHRKGATPSDEGTLVIPGSRGSFSYLVQPIGEQLDNGFSLAHGAGRKWQRTDAKARLSKYKMDDLNKTSLGSVVICESKDLLYEEAPQAYKNIDIVVQDLVDAGLIKIIAILRPLITYKTRRKNDRS